MSHSQNAKKSSKKEPAKTMQEKKNAKRDKKNLKNGQTAAIIPNLGKK